MKVAAIVAVTLLPAIVAGCATPRRHEPFLTKKAFNQAAAACGVVSQGLNRDRRSKVPYANYMIPGPNGEARSDGGISRRCLESALRGYRYDFLGEAFPKNAQ